MNIKLELLKSHIYDLINNRLDDFEINADNIADTTAIKMLSEIQKIVQDDDLSDFDAMEEIICIFEKYDVSAGVRHDFG